MCRKLSPPLLAALLLCATSFHDVRAATGDEPVPNGTESIVLVCGRIFDGVSGTLTGPVEVLVGRGQIVWISESVGRPRGAEVIDLTGYTCLPGFIDVHAHLSYEPGNADLQRVTRSSARKTLHALANARAMLRAGFTTVRVPGDQDLAWGAVDLKRAVAEDLVEGPRMFVAAHSISATGGHGDLGSYAPEFGLQGGAIADGPDEIRKAVRREFRNGSDWIKIMATGGFLSAGDEPGLATYTEEELRAAVEEAQSLGHQVCAHAHGAEGIKAAVRAGVRSIEHGTFVDAAGLRLMVQKKAYLVPTWSTLDWLEVHAEEAGIPDYALEKLARYRDRNFESRELVVHSRVLLAYGTDVGVYPQGEAWREFISMVSSGISPLRALQSATVNAAMLLERDDLGSLAPGKTADIIALQGNPLEEIEAVRRVHFVMKQGSVYRRP